VATKPKGSTGKYQSIDPSERRLVGLDALADMLGISRSKAHQLVQANEFQILRVGRRQLIVVDSIDDYIARKLREQSA
jgi:excisionase family DNA binding protein